MISEVRGLANQRSEVTDQAFFDDNEIKRYLNKSWFDLYNRMVAARENYFEKEINFNLNETQNDYTLPEDLYKILKLDYSYANNFHRQVEEIQMDEENRYENLYNRDWPFIYGTEKRVFFFLGERQIRLLPSDNIQGRYRLKYARRYPETTDSSGNKLLNIEHPDISIPDGFEQWIIYRTALTILLPEEADTKQLKDDMMYWQGRVEDWMKSKSAGQPKKIIEKLDYSGDEMDGYFLQGS